jgi:hypothetical protein
MATSDSREHCEEIMCMLCASCIDLSAAVLWQEGRNPLAGIEAAQPWKPHSRHALPDMRTGKT